MSDAIICGIKLFKWTNVENILVILKEAYKLISKSNLYLLSDISNISYAIELFENNKPITAKIKGICKANISELTASLPKTHPLHIVRCLEQDIKHATFRNGGVWHYHAYPLRNLQHCYRA